MRGSIWIAGGGIGLLALMLHPTSDPLPSSIPNVILWAWASKQDLRFIRPSEAGVAFLERTVFLDPHRVSSLPRSQPFLYTPGTDLIATVRMESDRSAGLPPAYDAAMAAAEAARMPGLRALEIDFDARASERIWYSSFLRELRAAVPKSLPITITALESWCEEGRPWLDRLPIADATPMLFRMGPDESRMPLGFPVSVCNSSAGVSTDEMPERIPRKAGRIYIFHPGPWSRTAYDSAMERVRSWRLKQ
jgi:Protein of unknown function (DUF3142)